MSRGERLALAAVVLLAIAASVTSLSNGFAYDDLPIIVSNARVHTLAGWWRAFGETYWPPPWPGDVYRPLTILAFAAEWAIGGGRPLAFHIASVALYAAACAAVYGLARQLLAPLPAAFAAALFAVHPVHVEAVGNVVGQAELIVGVASVLATLLYLRARAAGPLGDRTAVGIVGLFAVAALAKENGLMLPALLLLAECTLVRDRTPPSTRARALLPFYGAMAAVIALALVARTAAIGDVGGGTNVALRNVPGASPILTLLAVAPEWLRLSLWPARLAADYAPQSVAVATSFDASLVPGLLVILAVAGATVAFRRREPRLTFALGWATLALLPVSNLVAQTGILVAERTLFLPSVGVVVGIAALFERLAPYLIARPVALRLALSACGLVIIAGLARSAQRQSVWRDNAVLLPQMVLDAPRSYRAHWLYGGHLLARGDREEGVRELTTAAELFPYDPQVFLDLAHVYRRTERCALAIPAYRRALELAPSRAHPRAALSGCLMREGRYSEARQVAAVAAGQGTGSAAFARFVVAADSMLALRDSVARDPR